MKKIREKILNMFSGSVNISVHTSLLLGAVVLISNLFLGYLNTEPYLNNIVMRLILSVVAGIMVTVIFNAFLLPFLCFIEYGMKAVSINPWILVIMAIGTLLSMHILNFTFFHICYRLPHGGYVGSQNFLVLTFFVFIGSILLAKILHLIKPLRMFLRSNSTAL